MRADVNYSHSKNIGAEVGSFCDVPINSYDNFDLEVDKALASQWTVLIGKGKDTSNTAEILPGEVLCSDNIVRRSTTAEAIGYDAFKEKQPVKMLVGTGDGGSYNAEENQWYMKEKKLRQSTPEEMCAWLNNLPKRRFMSRVETDGADKSLITDDLLGNRLYAFRYFGGTPGTYIGGDEVRPLERPQLSLGNNSPTRVIQYFDTGNAYKHTTVELKEYADEWISNYTPTSNVSRTTIGGTALFDALKTEIELQKATAEPEINLAQPQICEWYPDGETRCTHAITHASTKELAGTCDRCYTARKETPSK